MKKIPIPVIVVSFLFIIVGSVGLVYHFKEFQNPKQNFYEPIWVLFLRLLAVVCGLLLINRINWARWIAIAWLVYHIVISSLNSTSEMIAHIVFLVVVTILLYLPKSSLYFQAKTKKL
jgi:sensor histidine kinase YesM